MTSPKLIGDSYFLALDAPDGTILEFAFLHEQGREGLVAEVTAAHPQGASYWARVTLGSGVSRASYVKGMVGAGVPPPGPGAFDLACSAISREDRRGSPVVELGASPPSLQEWLVPGWVPHGKLTIVYGDGGVGKSLFCLALAVAGLTGMPLGDLHGGSFATPWVVAPLKRVLYLDWEMDEATHGARLWGLCRPLNVTIQGQILYKRLERPFTEVQAGIKADIAQHRIDLVICDSYTMAAGTEPEGADAATRTLGGMGNLAGTKLVIGHVSKLAASVTSGSVPPFGSIQTRNIPKSAIFCSTPEDTEGQQEHVVTYAQNKNNLGPRQRPAALRWAFAETGEIMATRHIPDIARLGLSSRLLAALKAGQMDTEALAEDSGASVDAVRRELSRLKNRGAIIPLNEAAGGRGKKQQWGLVDRNRGA